MAAPEAIGMVVAKPGFPQLDEAVPVVTKIMTLMRKSTPNERSTMPSQDSSNRPRRQMRRLTTAASATSKLRDATVSI